LCAFRLMPCGGRPATGATAGIADSSLASMDISRSA
jgi:hypothetical protein